MTDKQKIDYINKQLIPVLMEYRKKGITTITPEQSQTLKQIYESIYKGVTVNLSCSTCIIHYIHLLIAWKEKHEQPLEVEEVTTEVVEEPVVQEQPIIKKKGRKKK
jgi:hypothetical protein